MREDFSILLPRRRPQERLGMARDLKDTGGKKTDVRSARERKEERERGREMKTPEVTELLSRRLLRLLLDFGDRCWVREVWAGATLKLGEPESLVT